MSSGNQISLFYGCFRPVGMWSCPNPILVPVCVAKILAIAMKELLPIVMAVALWGRQWSESHVLVMCDNMSVVCILRCKTSKDPSIMHLVRALHFFLAHWDIRLWADHVPGKVNTATDALSRNMMQVFHKQLPSVFQEGTPLPQVLLDLLVLQRPDWTSTSWRDKFKHFLTIA